MIEPREILAEIERRGYLCSDDIQSCRLRGVRLTSWCRHCLLAAVARALRAQREDWQQLTAAFESRSRQFHKVEQDRTGTFVGMHGSWGGKVYTNWDECPSHPCANDKKLLGMASSPRTGSSDG